MTQISKVILKIKQVKSGKNFEVKELQEFSNQDGTQNQKREQ